MTGVITGHMCAISRHTDHDTISRSFPAANSSLENRFSSLAEARTWVWGQRTVMAVANGCREVVLSSLKMSADISCSRAHGRWEGREVRRYI